MKAPSRGDLEWRLREQLTRFRVHLHLGASSKAGVRRYAVFEGGTVHGDPCPHADAQALRTRLTVAAILETFADAGVPIPEESQ